MTKDEKEELERLQKLQQQEEKANKAKKTRKRKGLFSKITLFLMLVYTIYFIERIFLLLQQNVSIPDSLIMSVLGLTLGECGILAFIKQNKIKKGE